MTTQLVSEAAAREKSAIRVQAKNWYHTIASSPEAAVEFVNLEPAQGAGEAQFSVRDDGQVGRVLLPVEPVAAQRRRPSGRRRLCSRVPW